MAIKIQNTEDFGVNGIKAVVYGASGVGKTSLARSVSDSIIISAEKGLLSLVDYSLPYIEVDSPGQIDEVYRYLLKDKEYETVFLDTVSEIGEVLLTDFLLTGNSEGGPVKDARQAYRMMAEAMMPMIRKFRDIPSKNIIFLSKMEIKEDEENGIMLYRPMIPGQVIKNQLPYMFDGLWMMDIMKDKDKNDVRVLQTGASRGKYCKDRSGKLDMYEPPNIDAIFKKAKGLS